MLLMIFICCIIGWMLIAAHEDIAQARYAVR